jgi:nitrous oxide reductase accessory protein NosL
MRRRDFILAAVALTLPVNACKKNEPRCRHCGMRIDRSSPWASDLIMADGATVSFDTPRCALTAWRTGKTLATSLRVQEYYERRWRAGDELRFILGGDVVGPMGPDLVPVDPSRAVKFIQDHGADRALRLDEITPDVLNTMK